MATLIESTVSLYSKGERLGEAVLTAPKEIEIEGKPTRLKLTLFAGYAATATVWEKYHVDIIQWAEARLHARMGMVEVMHALQKGTSYTPEQIFEAFMGDLSTFEQASADVVKAVFIALGAEEQKVLQQVSELAGEKPTKKKTTRSPSPSKSG